MTSTFIFSFVKLEKDSSFKLWARNIIIFSTNIIELFYSKNIWFHQSFLLSSSIFFFIDSLFYWTRCFNIKSWFILKLQTINYTFLKIYALIHQWSLQRVFLLRFHTNFCNHLTLIYRIKSIFISPFLSRYPRFE